MVEEGRLLGVINRHNVMQAIHAQLGSLFSCIRPESEWCCLVVFQRAGSGLLFSSRDGRDAWLDVLARRFKVCTAQPRSFWISPSYRYGPLMGTLLNSYLVSSLSRRCAAVLPACMNLDARRLSSRLHGVKKLPEAGRAAVLETIAADLDVAQTRYQSRLAGVPRSPIRTICQSARSQGRSPEAIEGIKW